VSIWVLRGLRDGVVTTRWPAKPDPYADTWRGPARPLDPFDPAEQASTDQASTDQASTDQASTDQASTDQASTTDHTDLTDLCPTDAITVTDGIVRVDQGRCILCGRCVAERPGVFAWSQGATGPAAFTREQLIIPELPETDAALQAARTGLAERTRALRRSVHVRHVDAGSDGSEEWEIQALLGPVYDLHRLGVFITASPRHADVLLVTGAGARGMTGPLRTTYDAMPDPKVVIAVGTDAVSGGLLAGGEAVTDGVGAAVPVDIWLPGSPPSPFAILNALLIAVGYLTPERRRPR
jgi:Ni,Fe-hydrogenase III small subunit/ferredoxin